jgi:hypothetical protein
LNVADRFQPSRPALRRPQTGAVIIPLAIIGLFLCATISTSLLNRNVSALAGHRAVRPGNGAVSGAEHAMWRLMNDPAFVAQFTGSGQSVQYTVDPGDGPVQVTVTSNSDPMADNGVTASLAVSPSVVPPSTPTEVTFTLTVTNGDSAPHELTSIETKPQSYSPAFVSGSSSGVSVADPVESGGRWRWTLSPAAVVPAWGGTVSLTWRAVVFESEGEYWNSTYADFSDITKIRASMPGAVRVSGYDGLAIWTTVTPTTVIAGTHNEFEYTITVKNTGPSAVHLEHFKHFMSDEFEYVDGSSTGASSEDPHRNHDVINDRWEYTWGLDDEPEIAPGAELSITAVFEATLEAGFYLCASSSRTVEDDLSNGQEDTISTGDTAPVEAVAAFEIVAVRGGQSASAWITLYDGTVGITFW